MNQFLELLAKFKDVVLYLLLIFTVLIYFSK